MGIVLATACPAGADTPMPESANAAPAATAAFAVSDPARIWVAGFFRIGAGFLSGQVRRDTAVTRGSQVSLTNDLDLSSPELTGRVGLEFRPAEDWRLFVAFGSGQWDGTRVQGVGTPANPTVESVTFDGAVFAGETIDSELTMFSTEVGTLAVMHDFEIGRFELGFGASYFNSELEVESVTSPGKRAFEQTESGSPWIAARVVLTDLDWAQLEVAGRAGVLWFGDRVNYTVNTLLHFWAGAGAKLGPFLLTLRLEYQLWETHQHRHHRDEVFGAALFSPTLSFSVRF